MRASNGVKEATTIETPRSLARLSINVDRKEKKMSKQSKPGKPMWAVMLGILLLLAACVHINSFTPEKGVPGTKVTIDGDGFEPDTSANTVKFGDQVVPPADVLTATGTKLKVRVPTGAKTGLISVSNAHGSAQSDKNFVVPTPVKWSFMIYLDGDNNLEPAGLDDFAEMAAVGSATDMKILVQMDRIAGFTSAAGDWKGTRRFVVQPGDGPGDPPAEDLGEQNMGDPAVLQDFVEWGVTNHPAEHYALVIWNHGGGWRARMRAEEAKARAAKSRGEGEEVIVRAVAWDDTDNDKLYMKEVQTALEGAKANIEGRFGTQVKLDVVGFDACLMGMAEVAYALRNVANYVVASEELEPFDGWPYDTILAALKLNPTMTARDLAGVIVSEYADSYSRSGITQSAVTLGALDDLVAKIDAFAAEATGEWDTFKTARLASRDFPHSRGVDLWDFADRVGSSAASPTIRSASWELRDAVEAFVIAEEHSADMTGTHGLAIYFPPTQAAYDADPDHTGYEESNTHYPVDFVIATAWDNWLHEYLANNP